MKCSDTIGKSTVRAVCARSMIAAIVAFPIIAACEGSTTNTAVIDLLIHNGSVYTGISGESLKNIDVGVAGGQIVFVGDANAEGIVAEVVLDATGLVVAPGFVDPHTHSLDDLLSEDRNANLNYLTQGVTTVINGNDGGGHPFFDDTVKRLQSGHFGTNTALFVGHGSIRREIMNGDDRAPTSEELVDMSMLVRNAMESGALGLSSGLYYVPGNFAKTDEVVVLARIAAKYGGIYDTHLRDESTYNIGLLAAVEEALQIGLEANIPVHISHIKALGVDVWGKSAAVVELIESKQATGQKVTANQYPWRASGTHLRNTLLPRKILSGAHDEYLQRLKDPAVVAEYRLEMEENLRRRGGPESLLIVVANDPDIMGLTLSDISKQRNQNPIDTAIGIMLDGSTRVASFNMSPIDIETFVQKDWVMTSSDGTDGHPRKYASFPKKYQDFVVKKKLLSIEEFLFRSSGLTAKTLGLANRGRIENGYAADIIVFDPALYAPVADFKAWNKLSVGVIHSIINGELVIRGGDFTGILPGQVLKKSQ